MQQMFKHEIYAMLLKNNPKAAQAYMERFIEDKQEVVREVMEAVVTEQKNADDRELMVKELKKVGIKAFRNWKDETIKKLYQEKVLSLN